jgi:hypothetical protein
MDKPMDKPIDSFSLLKNLNDEMENKQKVWRGKK